MKHNLTYVAIVATALLFSASYSSSVENKTDKQQATNSKTKEKSKKGNVKLVNINGATREELKKLPLIGDAEADKMIDGRPYATKAHLVTKNVITRGIYEKIKKLIVALQPYKDAKQNAALYNKKK